ncbi:aldo/keto reductase [Conexibacter woesei]|uniref:aldo/keto reductase n=1 Tax=Conexibacter woesei TaxID=191495 RepID=UPI0003FAF2F3|nr:aldo/keto reductase [Conexibacter woesei]
MTAISTTLRLADRDVPRMGLGTNRLTPEHAGFIREAVDAGLRHIDTAHLYTGGESERTIGASGVAGRDDLVIATKGGYRAGEGRPEVLRSQLEQSLASLRVDAIDLYYLHRVDPETPFEETLGALAEELSRGTILAVGLSDVTVEQIEHARTILPVTAVQNHYNLAERGYDDVIDHCAAEDIVFVPYFPLKGGSAAVEEIAKRHGVGTNAVKLAWLLHRSPTVLPIPGTLSLDHLRENLAALELELSAEELEALS